MGMAMGSRHGDGDRVGDGNWNQENARVKEKIKRLGPKSWPKRKRKKYKKLPKTLEKVEVGSKIKAKSKKFPKTLEISSNLIWIIRANNTTLPVGSYYHLYNPTPTLNHPPLLTLPQPPPPLTLHPSSLSHNPPLPSRMNLYNPPP